MEGRCCVLVCITVLEFSWRDCENSQKIFRLFVVLAEILTEYLPEICQKIYRLSQRVRWVGLFFTCTFYRTLQIQVKGKTVWLAIGQYTTQQK